MQVVEVTPIVKGITSPTLTYFSKESFAPGDFVRVPVRSGNALGIVLKTSPASLSKSALKGSTYSLKKLVSASHSDKLSTAFMRAAEKTAEYYAATTGSILGALISKTFLESPDLLGRSIETEKKFPNIKLLQLSDDERWLEYKSFIREALAQQTSVLFLVPTREEALRAHKIISAGVKEYVFCPLTVKPSKIPELIKKARSEKHPIVFIATPTYLAFDRNDLKMVIVERENSHAYRSYTRPNINCKKFFEFLAEESGCNLVLGDTILSLETLWKSRQGLWPENAPLSWQITYPSTSDIVNIKERRFEIISPELKELIGGVLNEGKSIFLFGVRKGLAPSTICGDCGSLLLCENCRAPLVLHEKANGQRLFRCHRCGTIRSAETKCDNCGSWKLRALGIGVDKIAEEITELFPTAPLTVIDKDHAPTEAKAKALIKKFELTGGILVGTELGTLYLHRVPAVAVVSLDSLFAIPDYAINERIFSLLGRLRQLASHHFLLQTRNAGTEILNSALSGNVLEFYRSEIKEREELSYPPFSLFIIVRITGSREALEKRAAYLQNLFSTYSPHFTIDSRLQKTQHQRLNMLIRIKRADWPNNELRTKLLLLSPEFLITVDPDTLL
jgi:primosomal protein N'